MQDLIDLPILVKFGSDSTLLPYSASVTKVHLDHDLLDSLANARLGVRSSPRVITRQNSSRIRSARVFLCSAWSSVLIERTLLPLRQRIQS
jgi:hypothetical protein